MDNDSEKIIGEQIKKLPAEVRSALMSDDLHKNIIDIGEKYHLHIDQVGLLENEVTLVMIGLAAPADLPEEITKQLSLQATVAEAIAEDISDKIFMPIREAMKKLTEQAETEKSVIMPSAAASASSIKSVSAPISKPVVPVAMPTPPTTSTTTPTNIPATPAKVVEIHAADMMLTQPTISLPPLNPASNAGSGDRSANGLAKPTTPPLVTPASLPPQPKAAPAPVDAAATKAAPYKQDPYREPPE